MYFASLHRGANLTADVLQNVKKIKQKDRQSRETSVAR